MRDYGDEARKDFENEHRYAQAALQRKRIAVPEGKTMRYEYVYDASESSMCDKVWIDRLTGKEVFRYDAADPANTNSYYGARPDEESFVARGLDYYELISVDDAQALPVFPHYDDGFDEFFDDTDDWSSYPRYERRSKLWRDRHGKSLYRMGTAQAEVEWDGSGEVHCSVTARGQIVLRARIDGYNAVDEAYRRVETALVEHGYLWGGA